MSDDDITQRAVQVRVSYDALDQFFTRGADGSAFKLETIDLPDDARILRCYPDVLHGGLTFDVCSETFALVWPGLELPVLVEERRVRDVCEVKMSIDPPDEPA